MVVGGAGDSSPPLDGRCVAVRTTPRLPACLGGKVMQRQAIPDPMLISNK